MENTLNQELKEKMLEAIEKCWDEDSLDGRVYNYTDKQKVAKSVTSIAEQFAEERMTQSREVENKERFKKPTGNQLVEIAILFNDGKLEEKKLADMVAYGEFMLDRLYETGTVDKPSSKE